MILNNTCISYRIFTGLSRVEAYIEEPPQIPTITHWNDLSHKYVSLLQMRNEFQSKTRLMTFTIISQTGEDRRYTTLQLDGKWKKNKGIGSTTLENKLHVTTIKSTRALVILLRANNLKRTSQLYGLTPCKDRGCVLVSIDQPILVSLLRIKSSVLGINLC